jgi:hypothetical protein
MGTGYSLELHFLMRCKKCSSHVNTGCLKQLAYYITKHSQSAQTKSAVSLRIMERRSICARRVYVIAPFLTVKRAKQ